MGMPTREEFEAMAGDYRCPKCDWVGSVEIVDNPNGGQPGLRCFGCNQHLGWLSKAENRHKRRRPAVPFGEVDRIWEQWGNRCGVCNLPIDLAKVAKVRRDRQHVPAYKTNPNAETIPICEHCNAVSAIEIQRVEKYAALIYGLLDENAALKAELAKVRGAA